MTAENMTFVLVHGAWADGSSWRAVIEPLRAAGHEVVAAPLPLTSLDDDVAALERTLARVPGPVVLVGHAYAGAVIGATRSDKVRALVYVAALAPDEGEAVADVFYRDKPHPQAPALAPDAHGQVWLPRTAFATAFAPNASSAEQAWLAAVQRPIAGPCINTPVGRPRWKDLPTWYLLAEDDRMIRRETQAFMAARMNATTVSRPVDHTPGVTAPAVVVDLLLVAANAVQGRAGMNDRIAIVTGASQGIGRATAVRLARDFAGVVLVARSADNLRETERAVVDAGARALVVPQDLSVPGAAAFVVDAALAAFGRIDAVVNIAGAVPQVDILETTDQQWDDGLALKLHGARRLTVQAWPALVATRGSVVFTSGNSALFPKAGYAAVGTINAAIVALAKAFADKGLPAGVQVNSVLPGPVMTGRRRSYLEHWAPAHGMSVEEATLRFPKEAGIERYGQPEEIADLMAFLVSPAAKWMTGSALRMDGGEVKSA